ncbi:MAG TPA: NADH-quinone oxidoreductase subunit NuoF [Dehalococcoidia bacterium]|nr:NADH-quinone oxidoreductase subunit NuoF [Dehalococcoidia bacterium]
METPLTDRIRPGQGPVDLKEYERTGGYQGLRKALQMQPAQVIDMVKESNLRGRGGAGFPTGQKWSFIPTGDDAPRPSYVVANGDEMEPGTFKDRILMEGDPHGLVEGMIIASYAIGAGVSYIFLRREYPDSARALTRAIAEAHDAGYLGKNVLGSGFSVELHLHLSAGRYMCGEETGLINSLEGKRANPRDKPPYPALVGLWGKPTIVNNVETLSNVPHIIDKGADWYRGLSKTNDGGTKLYGVSGRVKSPGVWELPMGTTMRELLEEHAGGMQDGYKFRGLLPGGASTEFLIEEHLDTPLDFDSLQQHGSRMGTGTMIILDDKKCPVAMQHNLQHFFAQESCGWCTPCWSGLNWVEQVLAAIEEGRGTPEDIEILEMHTRRLRPGNTFCALAPGAMEPLQSALVHFRDDFDRHVREQRCPWK